MHRCWLGKDGGWERLKNVGFQAEKTTQTKVHEMESHGDWSPVEKGYMASEAVKRDLGGHIKNALCSHKKYSAFCNNKQKILL